MKILVLLFAALLVAGCGACFADLDDDFSPHPKSRRQLSSGSSFFMIHES